MSLYIVLRWVSSLFIDFAFFLKSFDPYFLGDKGVKSEECTDLVSFWPIICPLLVIRCLN